MQHFPNSNESITRGVGYDIEESVRTLVSSHHMPAIPDWPYIPQVMGLAEDTLKFRRAPLDDILAILEVVNLSLRAKVNSHMVDWEPNDILQFGTKLSSIDACIDLAGNELIKHDNPDSAIGYLWPVFTLVKGVWNDLFAKGCIMV